jgi:hypothetical protein
MGATRKGHTGRRHTRMCSTTDNEQQRGQVKTEYTTCLLFLYRSFGLRTQRRRAGDARLVVVDAWLAEDGGVRVLLGAGPRERLGGAGHGKTVFVAGASSRLEPEPPACSGSLPDLAGLARRRLRGTDQASGAAAPHARAIPTAAGNAGTRRSRGPEATGERRLSEAEAGRKERITARAERGRYRGRMKMGLSISSGWTGSVGRNQGWLAQSPRSCPSLGAWAGVPGWNVQRAGSRTPIG